MPRSLRIEFPGAYYHVMARRNRREAIFFEDRDRVLFLDSLGEACGMTGRRVHAWVLMSNHYHLLIETPEANLVAGMQWLQNSFTRRMNTRHGLWGRLFGDRYRCGLFLLPRRILGAITTRYGLLRAAAQNREMIPRDSVMKVAKYIHVPVLLLYFAGCVLMSIEQLEADQDQQVTFKDARKSSDRFRITFDALDAGRLSPGIRRDELNRFFGRELHDETVIYFADRYYADTPTRQDDALGPSQHLPPEDWMLEFHYGKDQKVSEFCLTNATSFVKWNPPERPSDAKIKEHAERYRKSASARARLLECISAMNDHTISSHGSDLAVVLAVFQCDFHGSAARGRNGELVGVVYFTEPDGTSSEKWFLAIFVSPQSGRIMDYYISNTPTALGSWPQ